MSPRRLAAALAALCALAALACAPAQASAPRTIAAYGSGAGQVANPNAVAVDQANGDLYVADANNGRIDRFGPEGDFQLAWGFGVADGRSLEPQVCGPEAEPETRRCFQTPTLTASGTGAVVPGSLALEPATGDVFAFDQANARVSKYKPNGAFLLSFGGGVASGGVEGTGDLEAGSAVVRNVAATKKAFLRGQNLSGPGVPPGAKIIRVSPYFAGAFGGTITLSEPATQTVAGATLTAPEDPGNVPTNERQLVTIDPAATSGNFRLAFTPPPPQNGDVRSTADIPYDATPGEVQSALAALATIGPGNVTVGSPNPGGGPEAGGPYEVEFGGERYADTDVGELEIEAGEPDLDEGEASKVETTRRGALVAEVCTTACVGGQTADLPGVFASAGIGASGPNAFDPSGDLWVADGERLLRFHPDGTPAGEVLASGAGTEKIFSLAIDSEGDFFTVKEATLERQKISFDGLANGETFVIGNLPAACSAPSTGPIVYVKGGFEGAAETKQNILAALEAKCGADSFDRGLAGVGGTLTAITLKFEGLSAGLDVAPLTCTTSGSGSCPVAAEVDGKLGKVQKRDGVTGEVTETISEGGQPLTLTLDGEDDLYLGDRTAPYRLVKFSPAGEKTSQFGAGQVIGEPRGNALALDEGSEAPGEERPATLYVASSDSSEDKSVVQAFSLPEPGPLPGDSHAEDVLPTAATLKATLNPEGHATRYRFEYDTSPYQGAAPHGTAIPVPDATLPGTGYEEEGVSAELKGLHPDTTYHFRLVAHDREDPQCAAEACTVHGEEATFTTPPAVGIEAQWASEVSARSAVLNARLDPLGPPARWWVEYGTSAAYGARTPERALAGGLGAVAVGSPREGLQPGTTYHYRFAARDEREVREGGETLRRTFTVHGPDRSFTTQLSGLGFTLPDRRAWEMVSPPDKHGGLIVAPNPATGGQVQAAADGEALAYLSLNSVQADPEGNRAIEESPALARRGAGGAWQSRDIALPHTSVTGASLGLGIEYKLFSPRLDGALVEPRDTTLFSPAASERTPYLRTNTDPPAFAPLLSGAPGHANVPPGTEFGGDPTSNHGAVRVIGATPDLAHVLLSSGVPLVEGVSIGLSGLYEWSAGRIEPVGVAPPGEGAPLAPVPGSGASSIRNAISADGSRVFWNDTPYGPTARPTALYVRDLGRGQTARLDVVQPGAYGSGEAEPLFQGANPAGTVAFFTDRRALTADAEEAGANLYRCAVRVRGGELGCDLSAVSAVPGGGSAEVLGLVVGMSEDATDVYFVAKGVLDTAANARGESAASGQPNLYLWRQGAGARFIATLSGGDSPDWGGGGSETYDFKQSAAASPSGRYLAFMSGRRLTGYDNTDVLTGRADQELFLYDAATGELVCASCNPSGARPHGLRGPDPDAQERSPRFDPQEVWRSGSLAAILPEPTKIQLFGPSLYRPRAVGDDGRLFFNAADSLVPADSNGEWDVYEYEPTGVGSCEASSGDAATARSEGGCVSLISSGGAEGESAFLDASESGDDVFFYTTAQLSVDDEDQVIDIYDARVDGEPASLEPDPECLGEACQPPATAPQAPTPASSAFRGPGDVREAGAGRSRCAKPARRARALSRRAKPLRRAARRLTRHPAARREARRMSRKAARLARRARKSAERARRCRRARQSPVQGRSSR
jgi:hypothetical protein